MRAATAAALASLVALGVALLFLFKSSASGSDDQGDNESEQSADLTDASLQTDESMPVNLSAADGSEITSDRSTWPTGSRIWDIAQAIAIAEGANVEGSNPDRLNNPGDISDGAGTYGAESHSGSHVTTFPDKETGWSWLYNKLENIALGKSHVFSPSMTWTQFAQKYAGNWQNWVANVTRELDVDPNSTFGDYVNG
jgi:hypothetical protein